DASFARGGRIFGRSRCTASFCSEPVTSGSTGNSGSPRPAKSKHDVRSLQTARCQGLIAGMVTPNLASRNCPTEVWSATSLLTQPPLLQGETTYIGTRGPRPQGRTVPVTVSSREVYLSS